MGGFVRLMNAEHSILTEIYSKMEPENPLYENGFRKTVDSNQNLIGFNDGIYLIEKDVNFALSIFITFMML